MKYVLVLAVILIAVFVWRSNREVRKPPAARQGKSGMKAIEMVRCDVCGVHCPKIDALAGKRGVYCTAQHRSQAEP
jgi:uncharacterized protein